MEQKTEKIPIREIVVNHELYPRINVSENQAVVFRYENLMRLKEKFPPIVVNFSKNKYYLIDGLHRMRASMNLGEDFIEAIIHYDLPVSKVFEMAVELNKRHGYRLELGDLIHSARKLEKWFGPAEVSRIVGISPENLKRNLVLNQPSRPWHLKGPPSTPPNNIHRVNEIEVEWQTCIHCQGRGKVLKKEK